MKSVEVCVSSMGRSTLTPAFHDSSSGQEIAGDLPDVVSTWYQSSRLETWLKLSLRGKRRWWLVQQDKILSDDDDDDLLFCPPMRRMKAMKTMPAMQWASPPTYLLKDSCYIWPIRVLGWLFAWWFLYQSMWRGKFVALFRFPRFYIHALA